MVGDKIEAFADDLRKFALLVKSVVRTPTNHDYFDSSEGADNYSKWRSLQPPEQSIVNRIGKWLAGRKMLDVGVGGGRTTWHFAPLVADYWGVDYSPAMINTCKARFNTLMDNVTFAVADARDLSRFEGATFDFICFSYNGIDNIDHEDRLIALKEIHRVCAPLGLFCFSSHNLGSIPKLFRLRPDQRTSLYARARGLVYQIALRLVNPSRSTLTHARYAMVREFGELQLGCQYYIRPSEQLEQLTGAGFCAISVYGLDGRQVALTQVDDAGDIYLYYLAKRTVEPLNTID